MNKAISHSSVQELERTFLRKAWWLFPFVGVVASLAVGGPFWAWVDGLPISIQWAHVISMRAVLGALIGLLIPAAWRLGLQLKSSRVLVVLAVLGILAGAEGVLRTPLVQTALWLAARARLDAGQHFMREVCYIRLEEAAGRTNSSSAVVLVGSSQVLHGLNVHLLGTLQPRPVIRRAMFGMTPLKALAMQAYMPFQAGDVCVMYLSEFDFTNQDEFPFAWFRPYASWQTLPDVMRCVSKMVTLRHWRHVADYVLAASTEWWRTRDFLRQIVFHIMGEGVEEPAISAPPDLAAAAADRARGILQFSDAEWSAFRRFVQRTEAQQVHLLVFEGDVNPAIYSADRRRCKAETRQRISELVAAGHGRYVPITDQALSLVPSDWLDMTHLTPQGSEKLTRRVAQELLGP